MRTKRSLRSGRLIGWCADEAGVPMAHTCRFSTRGSREVAQRLMLSKHGFNTFHVERLFVQALWIPLTAFGFKEVSTIDMECAG